MTAPGSNKADLLLRAARVTAGLAFAAASLMWAHAVRADALDDIQRRGKLVVGVKRDVPPWGMVDPVRGIVGLEPDLAKDLARRLGVGLELVGVLTSERVPAVQTRRVDMVLATLSDTPERRQQVRLVLPHYYASGVSILTRRDASIARWEDLRHRRICGRHGSFYNRSLTVKYGVDIVALYSNAVALPALRDGRCEALLYDDTAIAALLQEPRWAHEFAMPLPALYITPWSVALHASEAGGRLEALVSQAVVDWHRSGSLVALESQWGIPATAYIGRMKAVWNRRAGDRWYCGDAMSPQTPPECL
jgi:polar amino acid transport system substrate-binding protein